MLQWHWLGRHELAPGPARGLPDPLAGGCAPIGRLLGVSDRLPKRPGRPRRRGCPGRRASVTGSTALPAASAAAGQRPRPPPPGLGLQPGPQPISPERDGPDSRNPATRGNPAPHRWNVSCFLRLL